MPSAPISSRAEFRTIAVISSRPRAMEIFRSRASMSSIGIMCVVIASSTFSTIYNRCSSKRMWQGRH